MGLKRRFFHERSGGLPTITMQMMPPLLTVSLHSAVPPVVSLPVPSPPTMRKVMRSDPWVDSIALVPFWRLDAKGGEVVLVGFSVGFAWVGISIAFHLPLICLCSYVS